jgi:hypothetical protein
VLEFAGAFLEDFELGLGESEHFFRIFYFLFFMIVRGIELFLTADVGRWTEINAAKLGRAITFLTVVVIHFLKSLNLIIYISSENV